MPSRRAICWVVILFSEAEHLPPEIQEWEIPREFPEDWPGEARALHEKFWQLRIERQKKIDASIERNADYEYLYDQPYEDKSKVRVAGPFTVESISPHRVLTVDENGELVEQPSKARGANGGELDFVEMIIENLRTAGVQQAHKEDKINFVLLVPWPGELICAEARMKTKTAGKCAPPFSSARGSAP